MRPRSKKAVARLSPYLDSFLRSTDSHTTTVNGLGVLWLGRWRH